MKLPKVLYFNPAVDAKVYTSKRGAILDVMSDEVVAKYVLAEQVYPKKGAKK